MELSLENTDEVTVKTLSKEINTDISHEDLDRMHRIDKTDRSDGKLRPIIIKFARYAIRVMMSTERRKNARVKIFKLLKV